MPRQPRIKIAHHAQLARHTGHNSNDVFVRDSDYREYVDALWDAAVESATKIHAFVLLRKTVAIFCTPTTDDGLPRLMQDVGRRYASYFNRRYDRSGALWNDRYRACLVESGKALDVYRYVESLPVRAGYVEQAQRWAWGSASFNGSLRPNPLISPHMAYAGLAARYEDCRSRYTALLDAPLDANSWDEIDSAIARGHAVGSECYIARLEVLFNRPFRPGRPGRPKKH